MNLLFAFSGIAMLVLFFGRIVMASTGKIVGEIRGFDVDREENLYIGREKWIDVIRDGSVAEQIPTPPNRSYVFYIEDNILFIACTTGNSGAAYDIHSKELSSIEMSYDKAKSLAKGKTVTVNGHEYMLKGSFEKPYTITKDGVVIYEPDSNFYDSIYYWVCLSFFTLLFVIFVFLKLSK